MGRIFFLMIFLVMIVHWISCIWYRVADSANGWLDVNYPNGRPTWGELYVVNFYTTLMMVMGDSVDPQGTGEKVGRL